MIPFLANRIQQHDAIFLEEPPAAGFEEMLNGSLAVDNYLRQLDVEFPFFSKKMCSLLRELKAKGKKIVQVEPFLEILLNIHEFFAEGHSPQDLNKNSIQYPVYLAERNATGALLAYYQTVMTGSFEKTIEAVKRFARLDAARFRLRDSLRAQELAQLIKDFPSAYIEAGMIHYSLWQLLRRKITSPDRLQLIFLANDALKTTESKRCLYGPGDQLTLMYIFQPNATQPKREALLAARSLIYSKLMLKEELTDDLSALPHLHHELVCIQITRELSLKDCRHLFPLIRRVGTAQAHRIVTDYLTR